MQKKLSKEKALKRKRLLLSILLLVLLITPVILYFIFKEKTSEEWYSSDWNYRRAIVIENSSERKILNEEVLIQIDTQNLIKDEKLQWDCDDLRFLDSDNATNLSYWIEGGCNTKSTQIWIDIPSLPENGKVIYAYYGNEKAPNSEIQWNGSFLMFSDSTNCNEGWTKNSTYEGKFLYGSDVTEEEIGSNTHKHEGRITLSEEDINISTCSEGCTKNLYFDEDNDSHILNISEEENIPPYTTLLVCESDDLSYSNQIAYFDSVDISEDWTYLSELENKFIMGSSVANLTGGREDHTHTISQISSDLSIKYSNYIGSIEYTEDSTIGLVGTYTESISNLPSYQVLLLAESNTEMKNGENNMILPTTKLPPLGWEYYEELENRIPLVGTNIGEVGGNNTHTHSTESFLLVSNLEENNGEDSIDLSLTTMNLSKSSNIPPSVTVTYAKRKVSVQIAIEEEETIIEEEASQITGVDNYEIEKDSENDVKGASSSAPTDLWTEGTTNPMKVIDLTPEFSAIFTDPDAGDTGEYYQIEVNTDLDFTGTEMWDSGKTAMSSTAIGERCSDITYAGTTLSLDGTPYFWRIKFWDDDDTEGPWSSASSYFAMSGGPYAYDLETEGLTNPTFLNSASPVFTAYCFDLNGDNCSAYQIEVNTTSSFDGVEYWDSGKVSLSISVTSESDDIAYKGTPLTNSGSTLYWRMTLWDTDDLSGEIYETGSFVDSYPSFQFEDLGLEGIQIN